MELADELFKKRINKLANMNQSNKYALLNSEHLFPDILDNQRLSKIRLNNHKNSEFSNPNKSLTILSFG